METSKQKTKGRERNSNRSIQSGLEHFQEKFIKRSIKSMPNIDSGHTL